jgi:hypothetical protein
MEETKIAKNSPKGIKRFFQVFDVVEGNNLRNIMLSLPFVVFLVLLAFLHITNNYLAEGYSRKISKTEKEVKQLRWEYMITTSGMMKLSKQSEVVKMVEGQGLKELRQPPYIVKSEK